MSSRETRDGHSSLSFSPQPLLPPRSHLDQMAAARPLVTVQGLDGAAAGQAPLPAVFTAPIRPDVVLQVRVRKQCAPPRAHAALPAAPPPLCSAI